MFCIFILQFINKYILLLFELKDGREIIYTKVLSTYSKYIAEVTNNTYDVEWQLYLYYLILSIILYYLLSSSVHLQPGRPTVSWCALKVGLPEG